MKTIGGILIGIVVWCWAINAARAALLFSEDFESFTQNQYIGGYNGWVVRMGPNSRAGHGFTATMVADGFLWESGGASIVGHTIAGLEPDWSYTFSCEVWASPGLGSHNSGASLGTEPQHNPLGYMHAAGWWFDKYTYNAWFLDLRGITSDQSAIYVADPGEGIEAWVVLSVYIDTYSNEAWGSIVELFGNYTLTTPHYPIDPQVLPYITWVNIWQDFRYRGIQIDNIQLWGVPEPTSAALWCGCALLASVRGSRRSSNRVTDATGG